MTHFDDGGETETSVFVERKTKWNGSHESNANANNEMNDAKNSTTIEYNGIEELNETNITIFVEVEHKRFDKRGNIDNIYTFDVDNNNNNINNCNECEKEKSDGDDDEYIFKEPTIHVEVEHKETFELIGCKNM